jgi:multiple sugar transport system permease protein
MRPTSRRLIENALSYVVLITYTLASSIPIWWVITSSFKLPRDIFTYAIIFKPTLANYSEILIGTTAGQYFGSYLHFVQNSAVVSLSTIALSLVIGTPAAFALSRFDFRGKNDVTFWILSTRMGPPIAYIIPFYMIFTRLHLLDTQFALVALYLASNLGFTIWMMKGFFDEIPHELDDAAMTDGCSRFRAFVNVLLPLTRPGLSATGIMVFLFTWNEFLYALILTQQNAETVPVSLMGYIQVLGIAWGPMTAAATLQIVVPLIFSVVVQKHLVRGLTLGAVKG